MVLASVDEGWSFGGSILTFLIPMLAFVAIAVTLLILYTKPELVPGRDKGDGESPVTATRQPGARGQRRRLGRPGCERRQVRPARERGVTALDAFPALSGDRNPDRAG